MNIFEFQRAIRATDNMSAALRLALFILSTYAGPTGKAWPSVATLAKGCGVKPRAMRYTLAKAERLGWITRDKRPGQTSTYTLTIGKDEGARPRQPIAHPPGNPLHPNNPLNNPKNNT